MTVIGWIVFGLILLFGFAALTGAPFVPSRTKEVREAFQKLYKLGKNDFIIDLGSGDGRVQKIASEFGASGLGIEINPILVLIAKFRLRKAKNQHTVCSNMLSVDFPAETTVVYTFCDNRDMPKIVKCVKKQAKKLHKPLYLISHAFDTKEAELVKQHRAYYLYLIKEK